MFYIDNTGLFSAGELIEKELTGIPENTVETTTDIETTDTYETSNSLLNFLYLFGVVFESTDYKVSLFADGTLEAHQFVEGARIFIDDQGTFTAVTLQDL